MTKYITELLKELNENPALLALMKDNYAIRTLLEYAFDKRKVWLLPEGEPPYKPDTAPIGMTPGNFYQQVKKLYIFTRQDLTPVRREQLFIQLLESLHPTEAAVLVAVKDHKLTSLYPNITSDLVIKEGVVDAEFCFRTASSATAEGGRELVLSLTDSVTSRDQIGGSAPPNAQGKGGAVDPSNPDAVPVKRKGGRPKGSKNKPKVPKVDG